MEFGDKIDKSFKPSEEWMATKYEEMNKLLFNGRLGFCDFGIFTKGSGSEGNTLGIFKLCNKQVKCERNSRRMFFSRRSPWDTNDRIYIDIDNFYDYCYPKIELNGNYSGTEHAFLGTLIHEMCHYYTYMNGYVPRQGHGTEFRQIASYVSSRTNGEFTVQRLATAEEMKDFELSDEMKEKEARRLASKKSSIKGIFRFMVNGNVELTTTSKADLIEIIVSSHTKDNVNKVVVSNDSKLIDVLFNLGFKQNLRSWSYWTLKGTKDEILSVLNTSEKKEYVNPKYGNDEENNTPNVENNKKMIFSIKTSKGVFECEFNGDYNALRNEIKGKFPNMKDEVIDKIISNKSNFKVMENRRKTSDIIREVIEKFLYEEMESDDVISIDPNMNLGLHSPLEME